MAPMVQYTSWKSAQWYLVVLLPVFSLSHPLPCCLHPSHGLLPFLFLPLSLLEPCQRRKESDPIQPLGDAGDLTRYPVRKSAFWKTTEKGQWWDYRHSGPPVRDVTGQGRTLNSNGHLQCLCKDGSPNNTFQLQCNVSKLAIYSTWFCLKTGGGSTRPRDCLYYKNCYHLVSSKVASAMLSALHTLSFIFTTNLKAGHYFPI